MKVLRYASPAVLIFSFLFFPTYAVLAAEKVDVRVEGIKGPVLENVMHFLSIEQHRKHPYLTESMIKDYHEEAGEEIRRALQPFGYYNPEIRGKLVKRKNRWMATYSVNPGDPVLIREIDIKISGEGADDRIIASVKDKIPLSVNNVFVHSEYKESKRMFQSRAAERGYLDAKFEKHEVRIDLEENRADVVLYFDTGVRYRFGRIMFQQETYDNNFLSRFVKFEQGDYFNMAELLRLEKVLTDSDYFTQVEVSPRRELAEDYEVPIRIRLTPQKKHRFTAGAGYGTDTGFRGTLGWENRRINRYGQRSRIEIRLSEIESGISGKYTVPLRDPVSSHLDFTTGWHREETDTSETERYFGGVSVTHLRRKWQETVYINYETEKFTIADETGETDLVFPGINWTRIRADDRIYTGRGSRIYFDIKGAHKNVLSDISFLQTLLQLKYIYSTGNFGRFIARGEGGASIVENFSRLPSSLRFFTGGDLSVRGYEYESLGPENDEGDVIGGKYLMVGSIEYELKVLKKWSIAIFYDIGNAVNTLSDPLEQGAGAGFRWKSPVGLVRLDLASAVSRPGNPVRVHLVIGPDL